MKGFITILILALIGGGIWFYTKDSKGPTISNLTVTEDTVSVAAKDLDFEFSMYTDFEGIYMLFGGKATKIKNMASSITLTGLNIFDAQRIYVDYPDFHKCSSKGSSLAKESIRQFNIIPADYDIEKNLNKYLEIYNENLKKGGDQICLDFQGKTLEMTFARLKNKGPDVTRNYNNQSFFLVNSVMDVNCKTKLDEN